MCVCVEVLLSFSPTAFARLSSSASSSVYPLLVLPLRFFCFLSPLGAASALIKFVWLALAMRSTKLNLSMTLQRMFRHLLSQTRSEQKKSAKFDCVSASPAHGHCSSADLFGVCFNRNGTTFIGMQGRIICQHFAVISFYLPA